MHIFEAAGLGSAPFRFLGVERRVYQAIPGDASCPVQPGGSCKLCGQAIYECCVIVSADGRRFDVGTDCVRKTGDRGMRRVGELHARRTRAARAATDAARVSAELDSVIAALSPALLASPHPLAFKAARGETFADYVQWMRRACGAAGRKKFLAELRRLELAFRS